MPIKEQALAKINLCLHVTGQRQDGYHLLDSMITFANFGDVIEVENSDTLSLEISGPFANGLSVGDDNLVLRAAKTMSLTRTAKIKLTKNLPVASGIGGGSADAAATLRALSKLWDMPIDQQTALKLGADVPVCLASIPQRMQGVGEVLSKIKGTPEMPAVLINSGDAVSTPAVFKLLETKNNAEISALPKPVSDFESYVSWLGEQRNDLQNSALQIAPAMVDVLAALNANASQLSRMSGSGATCFGLFSSMDQASKAAGKIADAYPNWWVQPVTL